MLVALLVGQVISIATCVACVLYCAKQARYAHRCQLQAQQAYSIMTAMQPPQNSVVLPSIVMQDRGQPY